MGYGFGWTLGGEVVDCLNATSQLAQTMLRSMLGNRERRAKVIHADRCAHAVHEKGV